MKRKMNVKSITRWLVLVLTFLLAVPIEALGQWEETAGIWQYRTETGLYASNEWLEIEGSRYHLDHMGSMNIGWYLDMNQQWYFFNPLSNGTKGAMLTGWQWIDGYCYYFNDKSENGFPLGLMYANTITPDGFQVNASGAWLDDNKEPVYMPGMGISTKIQKKPSAKGSGGGKSGKDVSGGDGSNNHQETEKPEEIVPEATPSEATPSDAENVKWQIRFVDTGTHQIQLAPVREGETKDGEILRVNFKTQLIDEENFIWTALENSPLNIVVQGPGNQIYYIEYEKTGELVSEEDPYGKQKELLKQYLITAKEQEAMVTGERPEDIPVSRLIVKDKHENDLRIQSILGQFTDFDEHIFYVIGKNFVPEGSIISRIYGNEINYSITEEFAIFIEEDNYQVTRFAVSKAVQTDLCRHLWGIDTEYEATCLRHGKQIYSCWQCGLQEDIILPALGHMDKNQDNMCDLCDKDVNSGIVEARYWSIGDVQAKEIDEEIYLFRCIDQNYTDEADTNKQVALFLCDTVIPANIGSSYVYEKQPDGTYEYVFSPGKIVNFGINNDYKYSNIRKWLKQSETGTLNQTNIGVDYAYMGSTQEQRYSELNESALRSYYIGNQKMTDKLFILSVHEALKYREWLWRFDGSDYENPDSQYGAYSKGYWLRNPVGNSSGYNTNQVYIVDLVNGNIRPQSIRPDGSDEDEEINVTGTNGVRPAFTMKQQ